MRPLPSYLKDMATDTRRPAREARGTIYRALFRTAQRGEECPTGDMLCEITGLSLSVTAYHVAQLERHGLIRVWRHQRSRVVEIVATGERTAASRDTLPHWRKRAVAVDASGPSNKRSDKCENRDN